MPPTSQLNTDKILREDGPDDLGHDPDAGGIISFFVAGTVLFASLVIGATVSLTMAGSQAPATAILRNYVSHGVWGLGGLLAAAFPVLAAAAICRRRRGRRA